MVALNKKASSFAEREGHKNWMDGTSFDISNPLVRLRIAASSCFFGEPMYYHRDKDTTKLSARTERTPGNTSSLSKSELELLRKTLDAVDPVDWRGLSPKQLMERAIDQALDFDPVETLHEAVRLRVDEHIRTTPQVILVRAAHHPKVRSTGLVREAAKLVIQRADEPAAQLAYQLSEYGAEAPIPNALKNSWRDAIERFDEYQLAKYQQGDREVKLIDVVRLVHAKGPAIDKLVKSELKNTGKTWEAIISAEGSTREAWEKALNVMGHMGLLRNIRNLLQKDVPQDVFLDKLVSGAKNGKQLPFRYYSAFRAIGTAASGKVKQAIEKCLNIALGNLPRFPGRLMALCDNSGSARGTTTSSLGSMQMSSIANLQAILAALCADDGYVGVFGDELKVVGVNPNSSVFDQLEKADALGEQVGAGTENGIWIFWRDAIRKKEHWDNVFVFSDMQAGHGGLYGTDPSAYREFKWRGSSNIDVPRLINKYRQEVNPNVNVFLVQVAGYQDTIIPEFYKRTYILGGWGEGLLRFAAEMARIFPVPKQ
jgi:hypothetical protein